MTSRHSFYHAWRTLIPAFGFVLSISAVAFPDDVESLHRLAWNQTIDSVDAVPAARYAFYAYRTLAVSHPETYLQSDRLISEAISGLPGSRLAYRSRDARDVELYLRISRGELKGGSFGWGIMTLNPDSVYDDTPIHSASDWFDYRAPSVAVLLKSATDHLTSLECALLRFSQLCDSRVSPDSLYVVVDKKGTAYLLADTMLWAAGLSNRRVSDWKSITPVMVFNRTSVFSAITGRDDRPTDTLLARLMGRLGKASNVSFNSEDEARIERLKQATALNDVPTRRLAVLAASGLVDYRQPRVSAAWREYLDADSAFEACAVLQLEEIYFWANRLSRHSAELASKFPESPVNEALKAVEESYLSQAGRRVTPGDTSDLRRETWGCLWSYDFILTSIDDNIGTRAGSSVSQALAISAVLDLAGVPHFQLSVAMGDKQIPDQEWLFTDDGRNQFNLGVWTIVPDTVPQGTPRTPVLISGYTTRGIAARFEEGLYCSRKDNLTIGEQLTRIIKLMPLAALTTVSPLGDTVPLQRFLVDIASDRFHPAAAPWPARPAG